MSDRIEKRALLRAPLERVWRAISDSNELGRWFGVDFGGVAFTESGFDQIPLERRAKAFAANEGGWTAQAKLIEKYVTS
jgi:hypothetical protein